ncbi:MAG: hypothetical protein HY549_01525 [Elusimicrobia bacterium]|nr:hypothetical protein [Elusimicrobiota bacterium]
MNLKETMSDAATEVLDGLTQAVWDVCARPRAIPRMGVGERNVIKYVLRDILEKFVARRDAISNSEEFTDAVTDAIFEEVLNGFQSVSSDRPIKERLAQAIRGTIRVYLRRNDAHGTIGRRYRSSLDPLGCSKELAAAPIG